MTEAEIVEAIAKLNERIADAERDYKRKKATHEMEILRLQYACKHTKRGRKKTCPTCGHVRGTNRLKKPAINS